MKRPLLAGAGWRPGYGPRVAARAAPWLAAPPLPAGDRVARGQRFLERAGGRGRWAWRWTDWLDRRRMKRYLPPVAKIAEARHEPA